MQANLRQYYSKRAAEYDRVYEKPERQDDLRILESVIVEHLRGRHVLDVAAGTGFWTAKFADAASDVTLIDINESTLEVARHRRHWPTSVTFRQHDALEVDQLEPGSFDAAFIGFFWSHVPVDRLDPFLEALTRRLDRGARVLFVDNEYVEGSNHPVTRTDLAGNTYQRRQLADGTVWEVLKNFPRSDELHSRLEPHGTDVRIRRLEYFWLASYLTSVEPPRGSATDSHST